MADLVDEFELEHDELMATIRDLDRTMKLKNLVLNAFIPPAYVAFIEERAQWNEAGDEWILPSLDFAGNNVQRQVSAHTHNGSSAGVTGSPGYPQFAGFSATDTRSAGLGSLLNPNAHAAALAAKREVFRSYGQFVDPNAKAAAKPAARRPYK